MNPMNFKIHRGRYEIGGSCVEVWTNRVRILVDFGLPLQDSFGSNFNINKYKGFSVAELISVSVLPDISGLYNDKTERAIDVVLISHPHKDHY